jgi:hypothetical protein
MTTDRPCCPRSGRPHMGPLTGAHLPRKRADQVVDMAASDPRSTLCKPARETARMMATSATRWTTKCFEFYSHA